MSKLSEHAEAGKMDSGFRASFLEEVAFEPPLMNCVRQSQGQGWSGQREQIEQRSGGVKIGWVPQGSEVYLCPSS